MVPDHVRGWLWTKLWDAGQVNRWASVYVHVRASEDLRGRLWKGTSVLERWRPILSVNRWRYKKVTIFSINWPKRKHSSFYLKFRCFSQEPKKFWDIWATFVIRHDEFVESTYQTVFSRLLSFALLDMSSNFLSHWGSNPEGSSKNWLQAMTT